MGRSTAVITTYHEADSIGALVRACHAYVDKVIVIDDASQDATVQRALEADADVHINPTRLGIGPSLMHGWHLAIVHGAERIVQIDAGGSHNPADMLRLLALDADLVLGSRFCRGAEYIGGRRKYASRVAALAMNVAQSGARWTDWTSGYRCFTAEAAAYLARRHYRYTMHPWQMEVLAHAGAAGMHIEECPITYRAGRSSFKTGMALDALNVWTHVLHHVPARSKEPVWRKEPVWMSY